jgi:hypothetical protein
VLTEDLKEKGFPRDDKARLEDGLSPVNKAFKFLISLEQQLWDRHSCICFIEIKIQKYCL